MTLLDRYLRAVAAQLPKDTREDIVAELRDLILNRFEAREAELGRPLTEAEQEALIREMGHPLTVASRYRTGPSHLIGPELYPYWLFAIKVGLGVMAVMTVVGALIQLGVGDIAPAQMFGRIIHGLVQGAITLVGVATFAGFVLERQASKPKFMTDWRAKDLAFFEVVGLDTDGLERQLKNSGVATGPRPRSGRSRVSSAVASAAAMLVMLLWWTGLLPIVDLRPGAGVWLYDGVDYGAILTAVVDVAFWPVLAFLAAHIAVDVFAAWRPSARRRVALGQSVLGVIWLAGLLWLWTISPLAQVVTIDPNSVWTAVQRIFEGGFQLQALLTIVGAGMIIEAILSLAGHLWRLATPAPKEAVA